VTAAVVIRDPDRYPESDDYSCTTTVATTVELQPPSPSLFGNFKRPRYIVQSGKRLYSPQPNFSFTVKLARAAADRSPLTVRARGWGRLKVPGPRVKAVSHDYFLRDFELEDLEESRGCELLCSPVTSRGFQKRIEVRVQTLSFRPGGIKVEVVPPTGLHFFARGEERFKPTPYGADVQVFQSGHRLARLRVAARCDSFGQSSRCKFKTVSMRH
jgi:hypothetical protein